MVASFCINKLTFKVMEVTSAYEVRKAMSQA